MKAIHLFLLVAFAFYPARAELADFELAKLEAALGGREYAIRDEYGFSENR